MSKNYSIALSHLALAGTGIYCLCRRHGKGTLLNLPVGTYTVIIVNSIVGCYKWGFETEENARKAYEFTKFLRIIFAMPCFAGYIWISGGYQKEIGYLHPGLSLIPFITYFTNNKRDDLVDLLIAANVISCGVISYLTGNADGVAATVVYAINHYLICDQEDFNDISSPVLCNLVFCAFTYLVHRRLGGTSIYPIE